MKANLKGHQKKTFLSTRELTVDIASTSGIIVTPQTVRNNLRDANIRGKGPRNKPLISEINRVNRLDFAKACVNKPLQFWRNVIFSDESKFNTFWLRW